MSDLGRPPIDPAGAGRRVHVTLTPTSDKQIRRLVNAWKCSYSEAIRRAIDIASKKTR